MKNLLIIALILLAGTQVYTFVQINQLNGELSATEDNMQTVALNTEAISVELRRLIDANTSNIEAARQTTVSRLEKTASSIEALENQLDVLEVELRDEVTSKLTKELVDGATSAAIEKTVFEHLPKNDEFILGLASVLSKHFRRELQGAPGEKVDPELLATFLARDQDFLDAMRIEILTENIPR